MKKLLAVLSVMLVSVSLGMVMCSEKPEVVTYRIVAIGEYKTGDVVKATDGLQVTFNEEDSLVMVCDHMMNDDVFKVDSISYTTSEKFEIKLYHTHHISSNKLVYSNFKFTFAIDKYPNLRRFVVFLIDNYPESIMFFEKKEDDRKS